MKRLVCVGTVLLASCTVGQPNSNLSMPNIASSHSAIIGGTLDGADPSVVELLYIVNFPVADCHGNHNCLQSCSDDSGNSCTTGATCSCGGIETCTGELIGPHTVVTAGHCTDATAGGELSGDGGPALTMCTTDADATNVANYETTSNGCNLALFVIFNNTCTTTDEMGTCETNLITNGDYVLGDQLTNPGYDGNVDPPYSQGNNDNDIGLVHLGSSTLRNSKAEPPVLLFNRADLGAVCDDLGALKFVGYGIIDPSQGDNALSGLKYSVTHHVLVKDTWHDEEDGAKNSPLSTCGRGTGSEPTCSGDSGGPSFNAAGAIIGITSLGDQNCSAYGEDTRIDAYADWIDTTMKGWGDPINGTQSTMTNVDMGTSIQPIVDMAGAATTEDLAGPASAVDAATTTTGKMDASTTTVNSSDGGATTTTTNNDLSAGTSGNNGSSKGGCGCTVGERGDGTNHAGTFVVFATLLGAALLRRRRGIAL